MCHPSRWSDGALVWSEVATEPCVSGPLLGSGVVTGLLLELSLQVGDKKDVKTRWYLMVCSQQLEKLASRNDLTEQK